MIDALTKLNGLGWFNVILTISLVIILIPLAIDSWDKFKKTIGLKSIEEIEEERQANEIKELKKNLEDLNNRFEKYCIDHEADCSKWREKSMDVRNELSCTINEIVKVLNDIKKNNLDEKIERMRWKILDFASQIRNHQISHPEQFNNVLRTYDEYETVLRENNLSNGQVDESIKFIREKYHELLK